MKKPLHNRAFFESSLEMKCLFFFGVALTIVTLASIYMYWKTTEEIVKTQNPETANLWASQYLIMKHWDAFNGTGTASTTQGMLSGKANAGEENADDRAFRGAMESLGSRFRNRDFECRIIRPLPPRPEDGDEEPPDEELAAKYEPGGEYRKILDRFPLLPKEEFNPDVPSKEPRGEDDADGKYQYYEPIRFQSVCYECHSGHSSIGRRDADNPYLVGELMGVVHVTIPKPPAQDKIKRFWAQLLGVGIVTAFLSLIAFYTVIRAGIIKPLRNLRDVAESISRGDITKRAELHTGDEFESVGEAFNRMLRHLVAAQDKLRKAYNDQEIKVDELAHLTLQLIETNRVKSDFMATMSHELRTPLNSILGFSDVLGSIETLSEKQKRYVENINKSGRSLLTMINDILDMAKIESNRMEIHLSTFPIEHTVAAQCDMAKPLFDKKNIDLQIRIDGDLPPMLQDESRIQQILNNLLSNA
ncbi:MAG TPA: hypothetical protein DEB39_00630, partial [Planctomycetaceae bacterium]|nr:hypothetical protein [Planctomycetaceae bacterium]